MFTYCTVQLIEVRDLSNSIVKTIKPPVQTNEIFYGGTASLILSSATSMVLYDIQQQNTIAEITNPPVKYIVWSTDGSLAALLNQHSAFQISIYAHVDCADETIVSDHNYKQELLAAYTHP